jgi:phosphopantetheinyl transferase (holo-ACP synthase)
VRQVVKRLSRVSTQTALYHLAEIWLVVAAAVYLSAVLVPLASGKPTLRLTGGARARMRALTPDGMEARIEVSLSDESGLANAVVIIFAVAATTLDRGE